MTSKIDTQKWCPKVTSKSYFQKWCSIVGSKSDVEKWRQKLCSKDISKSDVQKWCTKNMFKSDVQNVLPKVMSGSEVQKWYINARVDIGSVALLRKFCKFFFHSVFMKLRVSAQLIPLDTGGRDHPAVYTSSTDKKPSTAVFHPTPWHYATVWCIFVEDIECQSDLHSSRY